MSSDLVRLTRQNLPEQALAWASTIHAQNVDKGWWEGGVRARDVVETLLLIKSELVEAFEEYRKPGSTPGRIYTEPGKDKPEGLSIEIADAAIRALDLLGAFCREYGVSVSVYAWHVGHMFISSKMAHAIDDELVQLGRIRMGYQALISSSPELAFQHVVDELARHLVTLFRFADAWDFDLGEAIERKHAYNATRAFRHGNKKA